MNIYEKLLEVRKTIDVLYKENKGHGYDYVSNSQVLKELKGALNDHKLLLIPNIIKSQASNHETKSGKLWKFTEIWMEYVWINVEDQNEKLIVPFYSQGMDDMEKGIGKALTYGEKYFLLKFFNIPTDNLDPDNKKHIIKFEEDSKSTFDNKVTSIENKDNTNNEVPEKRDMSKRASVGQLSFLKHLSAVHKFSFSPDITMDAAAKIIGKYKDLTNG